ncbi:hypothetical protein VRT12_002831 [Citrobacter koseri]|uniref:hypothetical protein n=1 Tax=Citrobacter TaxID=544 RepID=UPI0029CFAE1F|nr:hypothetical protein [Citrobacter koseri]HAV2024050.1 hypothetical protein [Citrobacter koseri]HCR9736053.1 hypothetical protein [Citrobacter koseri]HEJ0065670.1 hypothetical protein [Citrobacter koseri]HEM8491542.1 hypothetical protein [Citrobacter koseri]
MLNSSAKYLLTASSVAPVCLTLSFVAAVNKYYTFATFSLSIALISFFLCWLIINLIRKHISITHVNLRSVKPANKEITNYFLAYLFPLITDDKLISNWYLACFFYISLFVYVGFSGSYSFNPLLSLLGYKFYEAEDDTSVSFVLISKEKIRQGYVEDLKVVQVTDYTYLKI